MLFRSPENREVVEGALSRVFQHRLRLECTIHNGESHPAAAPPAVEDPMVSTAVQLFGAQIIDIKRVP